MKWELTLLNELKIGIKWILIRFICNRTKTGVNIQRIPQWRQNHKNQNID